MPPPMRTSSRSPRRYPSASREGPGKVSERAPPSNSNPPVVTDDLQATFDPVTCAGGLTPRRPPSVPTRRHRDDPRDRTQTPRPSPKDPKRRGDHPEAKAGQARAPVPSPGPALGGAEGEAKAGPTAQEPVVGYSPPRPASARSGADARPRRPRRPRRRPRRTPGRSGAGPARTRRRRPRSSAIGCWRSWTARWMRRLRRRWRSANTSRRAPPDGRTSAQR